MGRGLGLCALCTVVGARGPTLCNIDVSVRIENTARLVYMVVLSTSVGGTF